MMNLCLRFVGQSSCHCWFAACAGNIYLYSNERFAEQFATTTELRNWFHHAASIDLMLWES